jgi:hypothetical protein
MSDLLIYTHQGMDTSAAAAAAGASQARSSVSLAYVEVRWSH